MKRLFFVFIFMMLLIFISCGGSSGSSSSNGGSSSSDDQSKAGKNVFITEIYYNPFKDATKGEFIELYNDEDSAIDINGWKFTSGIEHNFTTSTTIPSKGFIILQKDDGNYSGAITWSAGKLSNSGEKIRLADENNDTIDEVEYDDKEPWPTEANGDGPSLELKKDKYSSTENDSGANWQDSTAFGGSPGTTGASSTTAPDLKNYEKEVSYIVGDTNKTIRFDNQGGMATSCETTDTLPNGITLSLSAGTCQLDIGSITTAKTKSTYNIKAINSVGETVATISIEVLSATKNVFITEIYYNPSDSATKGEFIELYNDEDSAVDINGWKFTSGIEHNFTTPRTIPSKGVIILQKDDGDYSGAITWSDGKLSNGGEKIKLVDENNDTIDEVEYDDKAPWPTEADGDGPSLELIKANFDKNSNDSGANWKKSTADGGSPGDISGH